MPPPIKELKEKKGSGKNSHKISVVRVKEGIQSKGHGAKSSIPIGSIFVQAEKEQGVERHPLNVRQAQLRPGMGEVIGGESKDYSREETRRFIFSEAMHQIIHGNASQGKAEKDDEIVSNNFIGQYCQPFGEELQEGYPDTSADINPEGAGYQGIKIVGKVMLPGIFQPPETVYNSEGIAPIPIERATHPENQGVGQEQAQNNET